MTCADADLIAIARVKITNLGVTLSFTKAGAIRDIGADPVGQVNVISPYVRRLRLAAEIRRLRQEEGWTSEQLADRLNVKRKSISSLENGHDSNVELVTRVLHEANVDGERREVLMDIARQGAESGWWKPYVKEMGPRQAIFAELEAGAATIREYQLTMIPGLLQLPAYTEALIEADRQLYPSTLDSNAALYARRKRQAVLTRPGGPQYEVVLDELAIRRPPASPEIMGAQLDHLVSVGHEYPQIGIRVLPIHGPFSGFVPPRSAFSAYTYPDPADPVVVAVDTVTKDLIHTDSTAVQRYLSRYERLAAAAMSSSDSLDFLIDLSNRLNEGEPSGRR